MVLEKIFDQPEMTPHFNNRYFLKREKVDPKSTIHHDENSKEIHEERVGHVKEGNNFWEEDGA